MCHFYSHFKIEIVELLWYVYSGINTICLFVLYFYVFIYSCMMISGLQIESNRTA